MKRKNRRNALNLCPNCMSTLIVNALGEFECTKDRLKLWLKEFERFEDMNTKERETYLKGIDNTDKFFELYGKRTKLDCGYSTRIVDITPTYSVEIPDPMQVTRIEKSLGRKLVDTELQEGVLFYRDNFSGKITAKPETEGCTAFKIERVKFPDDCI